jgi:protein-disulfide isomerase
MNSTEINAAVNRDVEEGIQLGITSTPTFFMNGKKIEGVLPTPVWIELIERMLKEKENGKS